MKLVPGLDLFKDVLEKSVTKPGSGLMGIYVGSEYIGLSISCEENKLGIPRGVIWRKEDKDMMLQASRLKELVSTHSIHGFVVGYPYVEGLETELGSPVKEWVNKLCETKELETMEYAYCDQTSSRDIAERVVSVELPPSFREPLLDTCAAGVVLEWYLNVVRNNDTPSEWLV